MTLDYYVYVLMDTSKPGIYQYGEYLFDFEPFYVGKGRGNRIKNTFYDKSIFKYNKIKKLKDNKIDILSIKVNDEISNEESIKIEMYLIDLIGRRDLNKGTLVNTTDGGDGRINSKHTEETRKKISENRKGKGIGWKHTEETLLIMSDRQSGSNNGFYGKTHSEFNKKKQSNRFSGLSHPMFGRQHNDKTIDKLVIHRSENISNDKIKEACQKFNKPVLMFDLNFNFKSEFESVKMASIKTGINESLISKCCRGDIKSPTRYFFRYKNIEDNIKNNKYLIDIGDYFIIGRESYKLIKRNKKTCICEYNSNLITMHMNDHSILFKKDTNNIEIIEILIFLKSIDKSFRLKDDIIFNKSISIKYSKLLENSELFNKEREIDSDILIFEDEWISKKEIVKSLLLNLLNKSEKIGARKCEIKEITDNKIIREFLKENHIQGFVGSKIKIGLYYNSELVSLMTFGGFRKNMGQKAKENTYELLRFCNKLNTTVTGGASKLFSYFLKKYNPTCVISYADKRWSKGNLYKEIGFSYTGDTVDNYYWIINNKREYRFKWRKDILVGMGYDTNKTEIEIMNSLNHFRIFDRGNMRFTYYK